MDGTVNAAGAGPGTRYGWRAQTSRAARVIETLRGAVGRSGVVLRWRTLMGDEAAARNLEALAEALSPLGWRCVQLHEQECSVPLLWVWADVGAMVTVRATPGGTWAYFEAGRGRGAFLSPCGDAESAARGVDLVLRYRAP